MVRDPSSASPMPFASVDGIARPDRPADGRPTSLCAHPGDPMTALGLNETDESGWTALLRTCAPALVAVWPTSCGRSMPLVPATTRLTAHDDLCTNLPKSSADFPSPSATADRQLSTTSPPKRASHAFDDRQR
jgi:hypothetical protein